MAVALGILAHQALAVVQAVSAQERVCQSLLELTIQLRLEGAEQVLLPHPKLQAHLDQILYLALLLLPEAAEAVVEINQTLLITLNLAALVEEPMVNLPVAQATLLQCLPHKETMAA